MKDSLTIYKQLHELLAQKMPEIARQIEEHIQRGRSVKMSDLANNERLERGARIQEISGSRITKDDLGAVEYTGDECLLILVQALKCLGSTMAATRKDLSAFAKNHNAATTICFRLEGEETGINLDMAAASAASAKAHNELIEELQKAIEELS